MEVGRKMMGLELDLTKCNRCTLDELERAADAADLPLGKVNWKGGILVHLDGQRICWMAKVPDECTCWRDDKDEELFPPLHLSKDDTPTLKAIKTVIDHFEEHVKDLQGQIDEIKDKHKERWGH